MTKLEQRLADLHAAGAQVEKQGHLYVVRGHGEVIKTCDLLAISGNEIDRLAGREPVSRWLDNHATA